MPSIGAVNAMIVDREIERGIKEKFCLETQKDARRLLKLADRGGNNWIYYTYISLSCGSSAFIAFMMALDNLTFALSAGAIVTGIAIYLFSKMIKRARREFDALIKSNPDYWKPISDNLRQIVSVAKGQSTIPF